MIFSCSMDSALIGLDVLLGLTCVIPCVCWLRYLVVISMSNLGVDCPTPYSPIIYNDVAINFQIISLRFQPCLPWTALGLIPDMIVLSTFLGRLSRSMHWRWLYEWRCSCLRLFSILHRHNRLFVHLMVSCL